MPACGLLAPARSMIQPPRAWHPRGPIGLSQTGDTALSNRALSVARLLLVTSLGLTACGRSGVPLARTETRADSLRYVIGQSAPMTGVLLVPRDSATGVSVTMPHSAGLREGKAEGWYQNRTRAFEETWQAGRREGIRQEWDSAGRLTRTEHFLKGEREGLMQDFAPNGAVIVERPMHAGLQDGLVKTWYADGTRKSEAVYRAGLLQGVMTLWHSDGQMKYQGTFESGKPNGLVNEWYENGKPRSRTTWRAGVAEGPFTRWYDSGRKQAEGVYRESKQVNTRHWDRDGKRLTHPEVPESPASPHPPA